MCGFGVQEEKDQKNVVKKIHTIGCINRLQQYFESNLFTVGIVALCVAVTQLGGKNHYYIHSFLFQLELEYMNFPGELLKIMSVKHIQRV